MDSSGDVPTISEFEGWTSHLRELRRQYDKDHFSLRELTLLLGQRTINLEITAITCDPHERHHALQCGEAFMELWEKTFEWQQERHALLAVDFDKIVTKGLMKSR
ncbi:MAG: hypothetical protein Q9194_002157 [Teloschistes cf. exilis]